MSTRSRIIVELPDGYRSVYCHFDGYIRHTGSMLKNHYNSFDKAMDIINRGNLSYLDKNSRDVPEGHSKATPVEGYTVFHHRDAEEGMYPFSDQASRFHETLDMIPEEEYMYVFTADGEWKLYRNNKLKAY